MSLVLTHVELQEQHQTEFQSDEVTFLLVMNYSRVRM